MIHIVRTHATAQQVQEMLVELESYIKLAVDVRRGVVAGGGGLHADCETALLADGSRQEDVWGADWVPDTQEVTYESLINIRPGQGNFSMELQDLALRARVEEVVRARLGAA